MKFFYCTLLLLLTSCGHYVSVSRTAIDRSSLASTFVRSPDPLQNHPPTGDKLFITWRLPPSLKPQDHHIVLSIIYKDLTEEKKVFPLTNRFGIASFPLIDEKYQQHNGFYAYQVELQDRENRVIDKWQHQMWVNILN